MTTTGKTSHLSGGSSVNPSGNQGRLETADGKKSVTKQPLNGHSPCAIAALVIVDLASMAIVALGIIHVFGTIGTTGFMASLAVGGSGVVITTAGVIWMAISNCKDPKATEVKKVAPLPQGQKVDIVDEVISNKTEVKEDKKESTPKIKSQFPYSDIGQKALTFAREKLETDKQISFSAYEFSGNDGGKVYNPNSEIKYLRALYSDVEYKFKDRIQLLEDKYLWKDNAVIESMDSCLQVAYALCCLALDDLPEYIKSVASQGQTWNSFQAMTHRKSYLTDLFLLFSQQYHKARGAAAQTANPHVKVKFFQYPQDPISDTHANLFYQNNWQHSQWRALYNDFCDRVRLYFKESELKTICRGNLRWVEKDLTPANFPRL